MRLTSACGERAIGIDVFCVGGIGASLMRIIRRQRAEGVAEYVARVCRGGIAPCVLEIALARS